MINISKIEVSPNYNNYVLIEWTVSDTVEDLTNYTYNVYYAYSPDDSFTILNDEPITDEFYTYLIPTDYNSSVQYYFKVEAIDASTGETSVSVVIGSAYITPVDNIAATIIHQQSYFLENILNRNPVKLLSKKRFGTRCSVCWDEDMFEVTKSNCTSCYSVGYEGGYYSARDLYISFTEPGYTTKFDIGDIKSVQQGVTAAWAGNFPKILSEDIIVDDFNRRFRVLQVQPTTKDGRIYLRQLLQIQLIPPTDIIYSLEV